VLLNWENEALLVLKQPEGKNDQIAYPTLDSG
jgi:ABC-type sulfate transport system substrate-binding protein